VNIILLILCSIITVELFLQFKIVTKLQLFKNFLNNITQLLFSKKETDQTKEKILKIYSIKLLKETFVMFFLIFMALFPFVFVIFINFFFEFQFTDLVISFKGIIISIVTIIIYGKLRGYFVK
tara:strand:+ start:14 stop:382 length:369 start_codon:yes stop_codon:yes gene_type:complete